MRPKERPDGGPRNLFRAWFDQIVDMGYPLADLAGTIDWGILELRFGTVHTNSPAHRCRRGSSAGLVILRPCWPG